MSGSRIFKLLLLVVALAAATGGYFVWMAHEENRKLSLKVESQKASAARAKAEAMAVETEARENAKAKEAEARTAEAKMKRSENERATAEANAEAKKASAEAERTRLEAARAETRKAEEQKAAAEAETQKAEAQKAAAEASRAEQEQKAATETIALRRAEAERQKADAELAKVAAVERAAAAAREKSENERKTAEANAAAEHDRKLRMYQRAGTSRAELLALQRAEKLLALEESGALQNAEAPAEETEAPSEGNAGEREGVSNAVVSVAWPKAEGDAASAEVARAQEGLAEKGRGANRQRSRDVIRRFGALADAAEAEGRVADAVHHRASIVSLVTDYVDVYADYIDDMRKAGRAEEAQKLVVGLFKTVPEWERVDVVVKLLDRDEAFFSNVLAGRVAKKTYVSAFRKLYDRTRRDEDSDGENGRDPRAEKMQHICEVLAKYVPDYEKVYEWSGKYTPGQDE